MARVEQVADDGGPDEAGRAGDKHTHGELLRDSGFSGPWVAPGGCRPVIPACSRDACGVQDLLRTGSCVSGITPVHARVGWVPSARCPACGTLPAGLSGMALRGEEWAWRHRQSRARDPVWGWRSWPAG